MPQTVRGTNTIAAGVRTSYGVRGWGPAGTHLSLLNKIQERTRRVTKEDEPSIEPSRRNLQQCRDLASLTTVFKIHRQRSAHLQPQCQPPGLVQRTIETVQGFLQSQLDPTVEPAFPKAVYHTTYPKTSSLMYRKYLVVVFMIFIGIDVGFY